MTKQSRRRTSSLRGARPDGRAARTRAAILEAARAEFEAHGYERARTTAIADAAGVAEGTVFLHFNSKAGLLMGVMEAFYETLLKEALSIIEIATEPYERLRALLRHFVATMRDNWALLKVFGQRGRHHEAEVRSRFHGLNKTYTGLYLSVFEDLKDTGRLRKDANAPLLRDMLFGAIEHQAISRFGKPSKIDTAAMVDDLLDLTMNGARGRPKAPSDLQRIERKLDRLLANRRAS